MRPTALPALVDRQRPVADAEHADGVGVDAAVVVGGVWRLRADEFGLRYVRGNRFPTLLGAYLRVTGVEGYAE